MSAAHFTGRAGTGGTPDLGTVFKITTPESNAALAFAAVSDGAYPFGALIEVLQQCRQPGCPLWNHEMGGAPQASARCTRSPRWNRDAAPYLHRPDGRKSPERVEILDTAGFLYGTTAYGGTAGNGTVFKFTP